MGAKALAPTVDNRRAAPGFVGEMWQRAIARGAGTAMPRGIGAPIATPAQQSEDVAAANAQADRVRKGGGFGRVSKAMPLGRGGFMGGY